MRPMITKFRSHRRLLACFSAVAAMTGMMATPATAGDTIYQIDLNKTQILRLPSPAGAIVIGNPNIADVSVHSDDILLVVGRGFGETNLVILDQSGETMVDADLQVTSITSSHGVRLFNGKSRETYSCAPFCQPSPVLGDDAAFIGANSGTSGGTISQSTVFDTPTSGQTLQIQQATESNSPPPASPTGPPPDFRGPTDFDTSFEMNSDEPF